MAMRVRRQVSLWEKTLHAPRRKRDAVCGFHVLPSAKGPRKPNIPGRGEDGVEQRVGVGGDVFTKTIVQVVIGRAQWEQPVASVYYPADEGLYAGQRLVVGLGDETTVARSRLRRSSR